MTHQKVVLPSGLAFDRNFKMRVFPGMAVMRSKKLQFVLCVVAWSTILWLHENYEFVPRRSVPLGRQPELRGGALSASHAQPLTREDAVAIDADVGPEKVVRKSAFLTGMKPGSSFWMHCSNQRGTCACDGEVRALHEGKEIPLQRVQPFIWPAVHLPLQARSVGAEAGRAGCGRNTRSPRRGCNTT